MLWVLVVVSLLFHASRALLCMSSTGPGSNAPARVSNQLGGVSVRQQIVWARANKRLLQQQAVGGARTGNAFKTKFRQKKSTEGKQEEEEYEEIDYVNTKPPAIFVDGYNVIGHMRSASYSRGEGGDEYSGINFEDARHQLVSDLSVLRAATGWYIEVVFDAYKVKAAQKLEVVDGVCCVYTSAQETADGYIERKFEDLKRQGFTNMVVASDDSMLRTVAGSTGVGFMSAANIVEEMQIAYQSWTFIQEELNETAERTSRSKGLTNDERLSLQFALSQPSVDTLPPPAADAAASDKGAAFTKDKPVKKAKYVSLQEFVATSKKRREEERARIEALPPPETNDFATAAASISTAAAVAVGGGAEKNVVEKKKEKYISVADFMKSGQAGGDSNNDCGNSNDNQNSKHIILADINIKTQKKKSAKLNDRKIDISDFDFSANSKNGRVGRDKKSQSGDRKHK